MVTDLINFAIGGLGGVYGNIIYAQIKHYFEPEILQELDNKNDKELEEIIKPLISSNTELQKKLEDLKNNSIYKRLTHISKNISTFIGREKELEEIKNNFQNSKITLLAKGVGGIGKTVLAREFINKYENEFSHLGWINYDGNLRSSFINTFNRDFDFKGNQEEIYKKILLKLSKIEGNNLLVIDNFNNLEDEKEIKEILNNFKILITSRFNLIGIDKINLDVLKPDKAKELFLKFTSENKNLNELLEIIGYHTLMIEVCAKTVENGYSINDLIDRFKNRELPKIKIETDEEKTIIKYLEELFKIDNLNNDLLLILKWFSILPSIEMNREELIYYFAIENKNREEFSNNLNKLVKRGWVTKTNNGFKCHQIIQEFIINFHKPTYEDCKRMVIYFANKLSINENESPLTKFYYLSFAKSIIDTLKVENKEMSYLANNLSQVYSSLGYYDEALEMQIIAYEIANKVFDKSDERLLTSCMNVCIRYYDLENAKKSLEFFNEANKIFQNLKNISTKKKLEFLSNSILILQKLNFVKEALNMQKQILNIEIKQYGYYSYDVAISYSNLASLYLDLGNLNNALNYQLISMKIEENIFQGKNDYRFVQSYYNLSILLLDLKKYTEAKKAILRAIEILEINSFKENHPFMKSVRDKLSEIEQNLQANP